MALNIGPDGRLIASAEDVARAARGARANPRDPINVKKAQKKAAKKAAAAPAVAAAPAPAPGAPGTYTNTADIQPDIRWGIDQLRAEAAGDMGAGRSTELALENLRDLDIGMGRSATAMAAQLGQVGTGADLLRRGDIDRQIRQRAAGVTTQIAEDAARRRDAVLGQIVAGGQAAGSLAQGGQELALRQQEMIEANRRAEEANRRAEEQAAEARRMALLEMLTNISGSMPALNSTSMRRGGVGGGAVGLGDTRGI